MTPRSITFVDRKTAEKGGSYPHYYKYMLHWYETATHYGVVYISDHCDVDNFSDSVKLDDISTVIFPKDDIIKIQEF